VARQLGQVAAERVDQAVERLVRHRLALVAAAGQHHRRALARQLARGPLDEDALAHSGPAVHQHGHRPPLARGGAERVAQHLGMGAAPDQRRVLRARPGRPASRRRRRAAAQPAQDLVALGPHRRIAAQKIAAQLGQIGRRVGQKLYRRLRLAPLLLHQDDDGRAVERQHPGQRAVQHGPDRVPVAGRAERQRRALLRRHVVDGPDHAVVVGHGAARARHVGDEAEVEQHHAPVAVHHHIGRLDVAVQLVGLVQHLNALGQLAQRVAQPVVRRQRRRLRNAQVPRLARQLQARAVGARAVLVAVRRALVDRAQAVDVEDLWIALLAAHPGDEVDPLDQLHGEEPLVPRRHQLVQRRQVRVTDVGQAAELALEAVQRGRVAVAQGLERDGARPLAVVRLIDHAHPAGAEPSDNLEPFGADKLAV
jgi:hypothetical protein